MLGGGDKDMSQEQPQAAPGCAEELAAVRGKGKWWKIAALVLGLLLLALAAGGYYVYRRVMQAQAALEQVMRAAESPQAAPQAGAEGAPPQELPLAVQPRQSSLMAISLPGRDQQGAGGPGPDYPAISPAEAKKTLDALMKYSDRPLVKEFLADLARDPDYIKAQAAKDKGDPMAMITHMQRSEGMRRLVMKYSHRPEFIPLAQEIMRDPELRPLLGAVPGGPPPETGPAQPSGMAKVPGISRSEADRRARAQERAASSDADQDGELTFNPAAIGGAPAPAPRAKAGLPPPPVDSGR
jgi:hypothetical protein